MSPGVIRGVGSGASLHWLIELIEQLLAPLCELELETLVTWNNK